MLNNIRWLVPGNGITHSHEEREIVVSSRIRIARNLESLPFEIKMKPRDNDRLLELVNNIIKSNATGQYLYMQKISPLERESLLESHLISPVFLKANRPSAVFLNETGTISIMVNEEDHLRIQGLSYGLDLLNISSEVFKIEEILGENLGFAFHETYGYLTSCPTNIGTGMRASVLFHLPGLVFTNEIDKILKGAVNLGMAVRGIYGEGTEIKGNLFQISNQHTLGLKEEDLIESLTKFTHMIIDVERKTRDAILAKARFEFEDKVLRSLAILKYAKILSTDEVLNLLSAVRLGIGTGVITDISIDTVNEIMLISRPGNLQMHYGEILEEHERDIKRAEFIRNRLSPTA
ncbi:MAG TPA: protein arginine kinase [bacterium]